MEDLEAAQRAEDALLLPQRSPTVVCGSKILVCPLSRAPVSLACKASGSADGKICKGEGSS
jgi:hypothetical protein